MHNAGRKAPLGQHMHQLATLYLGLAHVVWQIAHARAPHHGQLQRHQVIGHITGLGLDLHLCPGITAQPPVRHAFKGRHGQHIVLQQILRRLWHSLARQILRAGQQNLLRHIQALDHHAGAVFQRGAHPQRHIQPLFHHIHRPVHHQHFYAHLGVTGQKTRHQRGQYGLRQGDGAAHTHRTSRFTLHLLHRILGGHRRIANGLAMAQVGRAHLR